MSCTASSVCFIKRIARGGFMGPVNITQYINILTKQGKQWTEIFFYEKRGLSGGCAGIKAR